MALSRTAMFLGLIVTGGVALTPTQAGKKPPARAAVVQKDLELRMYEDVRVRWLNPPVQFDDKGKPKKYTRAELKELKGPDSSIQGYAADLDALKTGQKVRVYLSRIKEDKDISNKSDDKDVGKKSDIRWAPVAEVVGKVIKLDAAKKKLTVQTELVGIKRHNSKTVATGKPDLDDAYAVTIVIQNSDKDDASQK